MEGHLSCFQLSAYFRSLLGCPEGTKTELVMFPPYLLPKKPSPPMIALSISLFKLEIHH